MLNQRCYKISDFSAGGNVWTRSSSAVALQQTDRWKKEKWVVVCFIETRIIEERSLGRKEPNLTASEVSELVDYNHVQICQCLAASKLSTLSKTALKNILGGK